MIEKPRTLGQHLRNRRLKLGLTQCDVARQLGCLREVYDRWERDKRRPVISEWPEILWFLNYYPDREKTAADVVLKARRCQGLDQKKMSGAIGVIHQKLRRWERGQEIPSAGELSRLHQLAIIVSRSQLQ